MSASKATITVPGGLFAVRFSISSNMSRYNKGRGSDALSAKLEAFDHPARTVFLPDKGGSLICSGELQGGGVP